MCSHSDPAAGENGSSSSSASSGGGMLVISGTGTSTRRSKVLAAGGDDVAFGGPGQERGDRLGGRTVADSPIRCAGWSSSSSSRSRTAPGACRVWWLPPRAPRRRSPYRRAAGSLAGSRVASGNDSGVVIRDVGRGLISARRGALPVSPDRTPTVMSGSGHRVLRGAGDARQRGTQIALDVDAERRVNDT